jgi:hypothetical protein
MDLQLSIAFNSSVLRLEYFHELIINPEQGEDMILYNLRISRKHAKGYRAGLCR